MARISLDVEEIKKTIRSRAATAQKQIEGIAKRAQRDLSHSEIVKRVEGLVEFVKSQDFMKDPQVKHVINRLNHVADQLQHLEKEARKKANQIVKEVRTRVKPLTKRKTRRATKKTGT
ncbi:MAG: hypothetical protein IT289_10970 [Oligoflexia bacterium]|nr:hypothetical protein [Oligoflexia bacterium]